MKVLLDHLAFVAAGNEEILEAMAGIDAHDMPEHGLAPDFQHGLGANRGFFGQARPETSCQDDHSHREPPSSTGAGTPVVFR